MSEALEIWEKPHSQEISMLLGWRQWADAGSISSGLPAYLVKQLGAKQIGKIRPDGFYLFQFPGTHDLVRPVVRFKEGYPEALETPKNELYYAGNDARGLVILIGDEPHMDIENYVRAILQSARNLGVKRMVSFGGVYGELPYEKERMVSCIYSQPLLREQVKDLAVNLSDYQGGASIGSYLCRRAGEQGIDYFGFYAFVPTYDFSGIAKINNAVRIENDFMAWLGVMRRVNYLLKIDFDLADLEQKSQHLVQVVDDKMDELDKSSPELGVRDYLRRLSEEFNEVPFDPLNEVWEQELKRLFDKYDTEG
ncbi:MAG: PAC2 family protein [Anaerolineales bacterium]|nr:MAG: PAC2 family protein [Anaerolineales bacterium]